MPLFSDPHGLGTGHSGPLFTTVNICNYAQGGGIGQTCGGKLFDRISGSHHDHAVASFVGLLKPQATLNIASGVAAGFRSARRRLDELLDPPLHKLTEIRVRITTGLLCIKSRREVSFKRKSGFNFLSRHPRLRQST